MAAPAWLAATAGSPALAGQVNQFLATHQVTYLLTGSQQAGQTAAGSGSVPSNGTWIAQSWTSGASQASAGYITVTMAVTGSPAPLVLSLQADSGTGAPSGTPLVSAALPKEFLSSTAGSQQVMLPATVSPSSPYWIVAQPAGDSADYFSWSKSSQTSGASASSDGVTWTAQTYGLLFSVRDQNAQGPLAGTYEDSGARWTSLAYNASGDLTQIEEYTAGQTAGGYTASSRALSYSGQFLTGVK